MEKNRNILITTILIIVIFFSAISTSELSASAKKKITAKSKSTTKVIKSKANKSKNKKVRKTNKKQTKKVSKKKKKKRHRRYIPPIKMKYPANFEIIKDTNLCKGVNYKIINYGTKYKHKFHLIQADVFDDDIFAQVIKAKNLNNGLEKLQNIVKDFQNQKGDTVVAAVNGNFWQAVTNYPIGPTIVDGEPVEIIRHKNWSSALFDSESRMYIDNYLINGDILSKGKHFGEISKVNRRRDSIGLVVYNKFAGSAIPFISSVNIASEIQSALKQLQSEQEYRDSSDIELDSANVFDEIVRQKQMNNIEFHLYKSVCRYLSDPAINKPVKCVVQSLTQGVALMPDYGCVVSYGTDYPIQILPKPGDTIIIKYSTDANDDVRFVQGVAGTPRIVRNGKPVNEAYSEGSHGNRFIKSQLPRTAIGTDKNKERVFLLAIEGTVRSELTAGATLEQLATIMSKIGAWNAMNLDGGGSTIMVIDGRNILFPSRPELGRRVAVGLGIIKIKQEEQTSK